MHPESQKADEAIPADKAAHGLVTHPHDYVLFGFLLFDRDWPFE